jgi:hypothetical protein
VGLQLSSVTRRLSAALDEESYASGSQSDS